MSGSSDDQTSVSLISAKSSFVLKGEQSPH
jgi:hypothetical protein